MQEIAVVLRQSHASTVPEVTLSPLVAAPAQHSLVRARASRLQVAVTRGLATDSARAAALRAMRAFLIFEEVIGAFLGIWWIQSLVQVLFRSTWIT